MFRYGSGSCPRKVIKRSAPVSSVVTLGVGRRWRLPLTSTGRVAPLKRVRRERRYAAGGEIHYSMYPGGRAVLKVRHGAGRV